MIITGLARLGADATLRDANGTDVADLQLAFNYGRKDEDGTRPTQWITGQLWGALAKGLQPYLKKAQMVDVIIEDPHVETYTTRDNRPGFKLAGKVLKIELAGQSPGQTASQAPTPTPAPRPTQAARPAPAPAPRSTTADDIPF